MTLPSSSHSRSHALTPEEIEQDRLDGEVFARCMAIVRAECAGEVEGVFGPGSLSWTMMREHAPLLGTPAAVLLQLAHPAVASGVGAHSQWERDFVGRARRTFTSLYNLVFGSLDEATRASRRLHDVHRRVRGVVEEPGSAWTGRPYRANDQHLLRWVATTVAVLLRRAFELFVRPFTGEERALEPRELRMIAALSGVLPDGVFDSRAVIEDHYEQMLASGELVVGPTARRTAHALLHNPLTRGPLDEIVCAAMLPEPMRAAFGLPWRRPERAAFAAVAATVQKARRLVPEPLRGVVAYHQAQLRLARARGRSGPTWARALNAMGRAVDLPTSLRPIASLARAH